MHFIRYNKYLNLLTSNMDFFLIPATWNVYPAEISILLTLFFLSFSLTLILEDYDQNRHETVFLAILDRWTIVKDTWRLQHSKFQDNSGKQRLKELRIQHPVWYGCKKALYPERWCKRHKTLDQEKHVIYKWGGEKMRQSWHQKNMYISISIGSATHNEIFISCSVLTSWSLGIISSSIFPLYVAYY